MVIAIEVKKNAVMTFTAVRDPPDDAMHHFILTTEGDWVSSETKDPGMLYAGYQIYWGKLFS